MVYNYLNIPRAWLFPPHCVLCDGSGHQDLDLCAGCSEDLPKNIPACMRCAAPLPAPKTALVCGHCQAIPPWFQSATAPYRYQQPMAYLIQQLKFARQLSLARLLGELMANSFLDRTEMPDCLIPVPLHPRRLRERGFNQALEISRVVGRRLNIPVHSRICARVRYTEAQSLLPMKQRRANVRNAFRVQGSVKDQNVAIVDDVITTGNTVNELARNLLRAGVRRVVVWAIAHA